jgi:hypothetical protein
VGGTSTNTKPQFLIEPTGTTSTGWSAFGTAIGVNAANGFTGNLLDLQVNGVNVFAVPTNGRIFMPPGSRIGLGVSPLAEFHANLAPVAAGSGGRIAFGIIGSYKMAEIEGYREDASFRSSLIFKTQPQGSDGESGTERLRITSDGTLQIANSGNVSVGTTTGTKFGTATTQKIAFYNATPIVQPAAVADATDAASVITQLNFALARLRALGLIAT